jgi:uncharacterized protein YeaO (DUF488 family)
VAVRVVRLGDPRSAGEGLRIGTVRRPPRGVSKRDYSRLDYYDAWLPELAPSAAVVAWALARDWTPARWTQFTRRYRREMREPAASRLISLLAALSQRTNFSVGCYCADETRCHRAVLRELLAEAGASIAT